MKEIQARTGQTAERIADQGRETDRFRTLGVPLLACSMLLAALSGCGEQPIVVYESVPKTRISEDDVPANSGPHTTRMIVAIADRPEAMWFFKLTADIESVEPLRPAWKTFLDSVAFAGDGQPTWQLPEGWTTGPPASMRFATLLTGSEAGAAEVAISSLPPGQDVLGNVNRWRGQLGLGNIGPVQLDGQLTTLKTDVTEFKIFDQTGPQSASGMGAPFAGRGPSSPPAQTPPAKDDVTESISYDAPAGWQAGATSTVTRERWTNADGDRKVELSLLQMNASADSWKMNVQAWASQIGMETQVDFDGETQEVIVAERESRRIRLDHEATGQSIIAVMVADGETGWVIKFAGDKALVDEQLSVLERFLDSVAFE